MRDWRELAAITDALVDRQWGEPVRLLPWTRKEYATGSADTSRTAVDTVGVLILGPIQESEGGRFTSRIIEGEITLSLPHAAVLAAKLREGDKVEPTRRAGTLDEAFEVGPIMPDGTGRALVKLVRIT